MTLAELAGRIGAELLAQGPCAGPIEHVYAGDRVSDLLNHAHERALLVSNLAGAQLVRLAELMDLSALCLVNGVAPEPAVVESARRHGMGLMVSPAGMFETCGRLYECLRPRTA